MFNIQCSAVTNKSPPDKPGGNFLLRRLFHSGNQGNSVRIPDITLVFHWISYVLLVVVRKRVSFGFGLLDWFFSGHWIWFGLGLLSVVADVKVHPKKPQIKNNCNCYIYYCDSYYLS